MPPTRKELVLAALLMGGLCVFGEVALRFSGTSFEPQLYCPDQERGWVLRPGVSGVVTGEDRQFVQINRHGLRDREREYEKRANTMRIAVLGNSWTEALQVPLDKTYCSVLERLLTRSNCFGGRDVEVLNFGVAGYSTGQELLTLQEEVWKYHPDIVLIAFYPARDIANNIRELNNAANPERSPYFLNRDGKLTLDDSFRSLPELQPRQIELQKMAYRINEHIFLLKAVSVLQRIVKLRLAMVGARERADTAGVDNLEYTIYAPPLQASMEEAWRVTEGLFAAMRDEVKSHGAEFRIVVQATRPQVIPDPAKRAELMRKLGVADLSYADRRIRDFAEREEIAVTMLAPALSDYAERHQVYLNGFSSANLGAGHWNATGHRVAAETIAADLCKAAEDEVTKGIAATP
jgi:hypothetical protein